MLKAENIIQLGQLRVVRGVLLFLFFILIARYFQIQILNHDIYHKKAEGNRIRAISLPAPRGLILDRDENILVDNYPTFILSAIPIEFNDKEKKIGLISDLMGISTDIMEINYSNYYRNKFLPVRLAKNLSFKQLSILEENKTSLGGTYYGKLPKRFYTDHLNGIHFLGYVGEINRKKINQLRDSHSYTIGDFIGWSGIEKYYEELLIGEKGIDFFEVNAIGEIVENLSDKTVQPVPGSNLKLSIHSKLQKSMEQLMKDNSGSVLISNAYTGEILSYVSSPDLSTKKLSGGTTQKDWEKIIADSDTPLLDRNTSGLYPPGSIFKLITLFPLLEENKIYSSWETNCGGTYSFGDRVFNCWKEGGHGTVNMENAVAQSCNIYFYQAVQSLTLEKWSGTCRNLGFGYKTEIDLPEEKTGLIPDRQYLNNKHGKWGWSRGAMLNLALGQGEILVTPIQLLQFANIVATNGKTNKLHFRLGNTSELLLSESYSDKTWRLIQKFIRSTITHSKGTGKLADPHIRDLYISGKTGTAQNPHGEPHAWFFGFGKYKEEILSVVVLIENGGHGGEVSAPIARQAFEIYFSDKIQAHLSHAIN
ncbi:MAG: penicillin-binding protein 2 [Candidatus Marinimicrobia bacterium]|nr:penicillin-binding protein 2 [Candidatus Neomarinimicrobiota bacterium]|tara:strand:+ start:26358 stop:28133 length:1776 start_codon:yes stop_codon:yes gene_type:complete